MRFGEECVLWPRRNRRCRAQNASVGLPRPVSTHRLQASNAVRASPPPPCFAWSPSPAARAGESHLGEYCVARSLKLDSDGAFLFGEGPDGQLDLDFAR